jgi:hypothetical protein
MPLISSFGLSFSGLGGVLSAPFSAALKAFLGFLCAKLRLRNFRHDKLT